MAALTATNASVEGTFRLPAHQSTESICALVVAYHPDAGFQERLQCIARICGKVIVIDNSGISAHPSVSGQSPSDEKIQYISNARNQGVAAALNIGLKAIDGKRYSWVITFDQDSIPAVDLGIRLLEAAQHSGAEVIGSNFHEKNTDTWAAGCADPPQEWIERKTVITSGMLFRFSLIGRIGPFRADYFIDSVDHEFCLRARRAGGHVVLASKAHLFHEIGKPGATRCHLLTRIGYSHDERRKYYIARNVLRTICGYWKNEPLWCAKQVARIAFEIFIILMIEDRKTIKLMAFMCGLHHGLTQKMGSFEDACHQADKV